MSRNETWKKIMSLKTKETRVCDKICNSLDDCEVETILAILEFFNANERLIQDTLFMLKGMGRFRVFDWLATEIDTLNRGDSEKENIIPLKVISYAYIKANGDIDKFIQDLRETDYQIITDWESIEL